MSMEVHGAIPWSATYCQPAAPPPTLPPTPRAPPTTPDASKDDGAVGAQPRLAGEDVCQVAGQGAKVYEEQEVGQDLQAGREGQAVGGEAGPAGRAEKNSDERQSRAAATIG